MGEPESQLGVERSAHQTGSAEPGQEDKNGYQEGAEIGGRLWRILSQPRSSLVARLYWCVSLLVTLLYLLCAAVSSLPALQTWGGGEGGNTTNLPGLLLSNTSSTVEPVEPDQVRKLRVSLIRFSLGCTQLGCVIFSALELIAR